MLRLSRQTDCNSYIPQQSHFHCLPGTSAAYICEKYGSIYLNSAVVLFLDKPSGSRLGFSYTVRTPAPFFCAFDLKKRRYAIQTNIMLSRTKLSHIALGMWMWFANKEEKVWFELLGAHSWCHAPLSHILLTRLGIYDISRNLAVLVLSGSRATHTHDRPHIRCCLELMKGKCREACLPQPANQLLPTSTDSNSTIVTTTHLTLNIDMSSSMCN